jgi:hypothetical protein
MNASFEEKSVWVQLAAMALGLGAYFVVAGRMLAAGVTALPAYVPLFIAAVVGMVALLIAGHVAAAVTGRVERRDERDRRISWRAESNSGWVLAVGVLAAITGLIFTLETVWIAHLLLASLFASEALGFVLRIVYYRRGV